MSEGAIIVPILEPGRSGVGDYARKLACELVEQGHSTQLCALHDPFTPLPCRDVHRGVHLLRLPPSMGWDAKMRVLSEDFGLAFPAWVSLQFVTYGFHRKGLPFGMIARLRAILKNVPIQIMFHELWTGGRGARLRDRVYGVLQHWIIRELVRNLKPVAIHTHATPYLEALRKEGWNAKQLPLFSNIPVVEPWDRTKFASWIADRTGLRDSTVRKSFCLLGSLYPDWQPDSLLPVLREHLARSGRKGLLLSVGHRGSASDRIWGDIAQQSDDQFLSLDLGPLSEAEISQCLHASDYGISTTPPDLIEKSAAAAAMFEHGLPVLVSRPPVYGVSMAKRVSATVPLMIYGEALPQFAVVRRLKPDLGRLVRVASQFIMEIGVDRSDPKSR